MSSWTYQQQVHNICESLSSCSGLRNIELRLSSHLGSTRLSRHLGSTVLDLKKHNKLEKLKLYDTSVDSLLLPVKGATITSLGLYNVTMTHWGLEQLVQSLSSTISLETVCLEQVRCSEHRNGICIPVLDLQKHNKLEELSLNDIFVEGLPLPTEGATITSLVLRHVTMAHQGLVQLVETLSSCLCLEKVDLRSVKCSEHDNSVCMPALDQKKHNKLEELSLNDISVKGLLLPTE